MITLEPRTDYDPDIDLFPNTTFFAHPVAQMGTDDRANDVIVSLLLKKLDI